MIKGFLLRNIQDCLQMILIFNYLLFYFKFPITEADVCFKKGRVGWKSQPQWPSIQEISKCLSAR